MRLSVLSALARMNVDPWEEATRLAAYLIFVTVFTMTSFVLFAAIIIVLGALGRERALDSPLAAAIVLLVVFVPAFFVARWQIRKPPGPSVRP